MDRCIMDTSAWVTRPELPKGAKDEVKPGGPPKLLVSNILIPNAL